MVATGSRWRVDGVGRCPRVPLPVADGRRGTDARRPHARAGGRAGARVVVYDDDHYYMGGVLAELLAGQGYAMTYATPAAEASTWTRATLEQAFIQKRLIGASATSASAH